MHPSLVNPAQLNLATVKIHPPTLPKSPQSFKLINPMFLIS